MKYAVLLPDFRHPEMATHDADRLRAMRQAGARRAAAWLRRLLGGWRG
ncbi:MULTISPECIES: hypothetical protein [unclassified Cupriavidus]|nr:MULTISPECIES: hypothetical protein [unclassified Cupriavidus]